MQNIPDGTIGKKQVWYIDMYYHENGYTTSLSRKNNILQSKNAHTV